MTIADVQTRIDQILLRFQPPKSSKGVAPSGTDSLEQPNFEVALTRASVGGRRRITHDAAAAERQPPLSPVLQDLFEKAADRYGIDAELLMAVAWTESGFQPDAESEAGAIGLMQLMPGTADWLGVDPHDITENIDGGAKFLRHLIDRFGRLDLALAAYNAGPGSVERAGGIPDIAETQRYVPLVLSRLRALLEASDAQLPDAPDALEWAHGLVSPPVLNAPQQTVVEVAEPAPIRPTRTIDQAVERSSRSSDLIDSGLTAAQRGALAAGPPVAAPTESGHRTSTEVPNNSEASTDSGMELSTPTVARRLADDPEPAREPVGNTQLASIEDFASTQAASTNPGEPEETPDDNQHVRTAATSDVAPTHDSTYVETAEAELDAVTQTGPINSAGPARTQTSTVRSTTPLAPARIPDLVATMAQRGGNQTLTFEFDPPDLGDVRVQVVVRGQTVTVNITTRSDEASLAVEQLRQRIERSLDTEGFHLDEFDVANQSDGERQRRREQHRDLRVPTLLANVEAEINSTPSATQERAHRYANIIRL